MVGTSGIAGERAGLVTASALTLPLSTRPLTACTEEMVIGTWPAMTSPIAWPPPLYGTCTACMPVLSMNTSKLRCETEPTPAEAKFIFCGTVFE
jgi:hypothetical protein